MHPRIEMHLFVLIIFIHSVKVPCLHAVNYHVITFMEKGSFLNRSSQIKHYTILNKNNFTVHATYVQMNEDESLEMLLNKFSRIDVRTSSRKINLYSSFVNAKILAMLENVLASENETLHALQQEGCLKEAEDINLLLEKCKKFKLVYADLIRSLITNLYPWPVAIIGEHEDCSLELSTVLADKLHKTIQLNGRNEQSKVWSYTLQGNTTNIHKLMQIMYDIKIKSVSVVVLLCSDDLSKLIFKVASKFSDLRFRTVWLTIDSKSRVDDKYAPSQLLVIKHDSINTAIKWSLLAKRKFVDALNLMLVAKDAKKRGLILDSGFRSVGAIAEKQLKTEDCSDLRSFKTALVYLRKSKHSWIPLYKWNDRGSLIILPNDAEILKMLRTKLQGVTLRIVTIIEHPFIMQFDKFYAKSERKCQHGVICHSPVFNSNVVTWRETCCIGYLIDMLQKLQNDLWFQTYMYIVEDGFYGAYINGSWNGMVGDLVRNKADFSVSTITSTRERSTVISFSEPYMKVALSIIMLAKQDYDLPFLNFAFLDQITEKLLWAILGVFLAGMTLVYLLENQSRNVEDKIKKLKNYPLKECFTYFSGLTFQRDLGGHNPTQIATRITAIAFAFGMVIVMTTYTAILTASKVKQAEKDPFQGFADQRMTKPTTNFRFATLANSSTSAYFGTSADPNFRNMYLFMKNYNAKSNEAGIKGVLDRTLHAFITENPQAQYHAAKQRDCGLKVVETEKGIASWAIAFQKGFAWKHLISQKILEYRESGLLADLSRKWTASACLNVKNNTSSPSSVPFEDFGGLILVLVGSFGVSILILLIENCYNKYRKKIIKPVSSKYHFDVWEEIENNAAEKQNMVEMITFKHRNNTSFC